jgi:nicotinamide-nucleotide amidase
MALARRNKSTIHREEHFGAIGRGPVRVRSLQSMMDMLEQALASERHSS